MAFGGFTDLFDKKKSDTRSVNDPEIPNLGIEAVINLNSARKQAGLAKMVISFRSGV